MINDIIDEKQKSKFLQNMDLSSIKVAALNDLSFGSRMQRGKNREQNQSESFTVSANEVHGPRTQAAEHS